MGEEEARKQPFKKICGIAPDDGWCPHVATHPGHNFICDFCDEEVYGPPEDFCLHNQEYHRGYCEAEKRFIELLDAGEI